MGSRPEFLVQEKGLSRVPVDMDRQFSDRKSVLFHNHSFPLPIRKNPVLIWKDQARQSAFLPVERSL